MMLRPAPINRPAMDILTPWSEESLGSRPLRQIISTAAASLTWVANLAVFNPFGVSQPFLVREVFWMNGSAAGSNIDVGIYDTAGNRLASLGSTAQGAANNVIVSSTFTDYTLAPGDYYMAFGAVGTTNVAAGWAPTAEIVAAWGVGQMATAVALPNPATIVPLTNAVLPFFGLNGLAVAP